ncbi:MAG: RecX family transcriptional regulator [Thermomicrobiales bacterium]|nr:RecX family transcriptional regulator [Thermomicrobiales bacterium]
MNRGDARELPAFGTISAIRQQARNPERVNVFLDGQYAFAVTREEAIGAGLKIGRDLTIDEVARLRAGDLVSKAIESALRLLGVRPRSERELRDRLKRKEFDPETIDLALERVRGWGYLDDAEFARRWVENRLQHRPRGERLIKQELRVKGVDAATIDDVIEESSIDEHAAAMAVAEKAARRLQGLEPEVARRRLIGQLARRGFPYAVISPVVKQVLGEGEEDEFSEDLP